MAEVVGEVGHPDLGAPPSANLMKFRQVTERCVPANTVPEDRSGRVSVEDRGT